MKYTPLKQWVRFARAGKFSSTLGFGDPGIAVIFYLRSGSARVMPFKVSAPGEREREAPTAFRRGHQKHNGPENKQKHAGAPTEERRNFCLAAPG